MSATSDIQTKYHLGVIRKITILAVSCIGVVLVVGLLSLSVCENISLSEAYTLIWNHITGVQYPERSQDWWNDRFIWNRSIPRALCAILAGMGLAASGVMMQSLMNNPLADHIKSVLEWDVAGNFHFAKWYCQFELFHYNDILSYFTKA